MADDDDRHHRAAARRAGRRRAGDRRDAARCSHPSGSARRRDPRAGSPMTKPELLALVTAAESTHDAIEAIAGVVAVATRRARQAGDRPAPGDRSGAPQHRSARRVGGKDHRSGAAVRRRGGTAPGGGVAARPRYRQRRRRACAPDAWPTSSPKPQPTSSTARAKRWRGPRVGRGGPPYRRDRHRRRGCRRSRRASGRTPVASNFTRSARRPRQWSNPASPNNARRSSRRPSARACRSA